jgi:hypothetical protein
MSECRSRESAGGRQTAQAPACCNGTGRRDVDGLDRRTGWARGGSLAWQLYDPSGKVIGEKGTNPGVELWCGSYRISSLTRSPASRESPPPCKHDLISGLATDLAKEDIQVVARRKHEETSSRKEKGAPQGVVSGEFLGRRGFQCQRKPQGMQIRFL